MLERIFYKMMMIGNEDEYLYRPLEKQDVYDILNAETKEQNKCKYCHEPFLDLSEKTDDQIDWEYLAYCSLDENRNLVYGSLDDGYEGQSAETLINYCPMCGRRLSDE